MRHNRIEVFRLALLILAALGIVALGFMGGLFMDRNHKTAQTVYPSTAPKVYLAQARRTQLYRSGIKGDAVLYRVVDMPSENLRCVMLVGTGAFGRAVSCQPLNILEGR